MSREAWCASVAAASSAGSTGAARYWTLPSSAANILKRSDACADSPYLLYHIAIRLTYGNVFRTQEDINPLS